MTIQEFYDMLERHDWYYAMSDDHSYWVAGERSVKEIRTAAAEGGPEFELLLSQYYEHMFSGEHWGSERAPKPERPISK